MSSKFFMSKRENSIKVAYPTSADDPSKSGSQKLIETISFNPSNVKLIDQKEFLQKEVREVLRKKKN